MTSTLHLDFVSDVSCPRCAAAWAALQHAMAELAGELQFTLRCQPCSLTLQPPEAGEPSNAFNAHRLLHWAGVAHGDQQAALHLALLQACHLKHLALNDPKVLLACVRAAGLHEHEACDLLASDRYVDELHLLQAFYADAGIHTLPVVVVNQEHVIHGGQPPEVYAQALREIAARVEH